MIGRKTVIKRNKEEREKKTELLTVGQNRTFHFSPLSFHGQKFSNIAQKLDHLWEDYVSSSA